MDSSSGSATELAKACMAGYKISWVLFKHGTVVAVSETVEESEAKEQALALMKEFGPVYAGCPHGDFNVVKCPTSGWVVTSHHNKINTFVTPQDEFPPNPDIYVVGLFGRNCRDLDSKELEIEHVHIQPSQN